MGYEKLTGDIYTDDIAGLVHELNLNKNKFRSFTFDRRGDHFVFQIENADDNDQKKLFKVMDKYIKKSKGKVKREKDGIETDEGEKT